MANGTKRPAPARRPRLRAAGGLGGPRDGGPRDGGPGDGGPGVGGQPQDPDGPGYFERYEPQPGPRRWRRMPQHVGEDLRLLTRPVLKKRGFETADILLRWDEIAGEKLARRTVPERLTKPQSGGPGVLVLRAGGPAALLVQHETPRIIERVNSYFGFQAVDRIRIVQGPLPRLPEQGKPALPALSPEQSQGLAARLDGVSHEGLRKALEKLGRGVLGGTPAAGPGKRD